MDIYALGPYCVDTLNGVLLHGGEPEALGRRAVRKLRGLLSRRRG